MMGRTIEDLDHILTTSRRKKAEAKLRCVVKTCDETFGVETKWITHIREAHQQEISHLGTEQFSEWVSQQKEECKIVKPRAKSGAAATPNSARDRTSRPTGPSTRGGGELARGVENIQLEVECSPPEISRDGDTSMGEAAPVQEAHKKPGSTRKASHRKARNHGHSARREVDPDFDRGPQSSQRQIWTEDQPISKRVDTSQHSPTLSRQRKDKKVKPVDKCKPHESPTPPGSGPPAFSKVLETNPHGVGPMILRSQAQVGQHRGDYKVAQEGDPRLKMVRQPETRPITPEQLLNEVRGIYAGLVMVEAKCMEVDKKQAAQVKELEIEGYRPQELTNEQFQALIALHRTLLHEHHDFFLASQHPSAEPSLQRLAAKYEMPARMWRHGIHSFLELLRNRLPYSLEHMLTFIYLAYSMMALLYETVPAFEDTWIECLGDLGRYRMAIEDGDIRDREVWTTVARTWYYKASDRKPTVGRLYHHISILARPNVLQQLFYYCKSLTVSIPFSAARESILSLFAPISGNAPRSHSTDVSLVTLHAKWFTHTDLEHFEGLLDDYIDTLDKHLQTSSEKWTVRGCLVAICNIAALYQYNTATGSQLRAEFEGRRKAIKEEEAEEGFRLTDSNAGEGLLLPPLTKAGHVETKHVQNLREGGASRLLADESQDASWVDFQYALKMGFTILKLVLERGVDDQVLPHVHAWLAFLYHVRGSIPVMRLLETDFPWENLAAFLNSLVERPDSFSPPTTNFATDEFPKGQGRPLPEDYTLRGLEWTSDYFPSRWIEDAKVDEEERLLELPSFLALRTERLLWLGYKIAMAGDWMHYNPQKAEFSLHSGVKERIDSFRRETLIKKEVDIPYIKKEVDIPYIKKEEVDIPYIKKEEESDIEMKSVELVDETYDGFADSEQPEELLRLRALQQELKIQLKRENPVEEYPEMNMEATRRVSAQEALKPQYTTLVVDTNLMLSSLDIFKSVLDDNAWPVVVPNPVLTELTGLQNSNESVAEAAKRAILVIKNAIASKKDVKIITAKGSNVTQEGFYREKLDEYQQDEKKLDDVIIEITQLVGNQRAEIMRKNGVDPGQAQPAVLVTDDRNMRVKATAKSVPAIESPALRAIITPRATMTSTRQKRKSNAASPFRALKQGFPNCSNASIASALEQADGNIETALYILTQLEAGRQVRKPKRGDTAHGAGTD